MNQGGFMQDGGGSASNSQQSDRQVSFRSLTIKQLQQCRESSPDSKMFEVDGAAVHIVRIVGIIREIDPMETSTNYEIQDTTGSLTAKQWNSRPGEEAEAKPDSPEERGFDKGDYVAMFLTVRSFQNKTMYNAIRVDPKISLGFVMLHQLSVLQEHCFYTGATVGNSNSAADQANGASSLFQPEDTGNSELDLKNKIFNLLRGSGESLHTDYIARELGRDKYTIETILDSLLEDGQVYDDAGSWAIS